MNRDDKKSYNAKEIKAAFCSYFYGSGGDFFFPHPKLDETPKKDCEDAVEVRCDEFLKILKSSNKGG